MKTKRLYGIPCLFLMAVMMISDCLIAQESGDRYHARSGENVLRVLVIKRTAAPVSGLKLRFAPNQPSWFTGQAERLLEFTDEKALDVGLPFQVTTTGTANDAVTLELLEGEKLIGSLLVQLGVGEPSGKLSANGSAATAIADIMTAANEQLVPIDFALRQNYPNPFNPTTAISYDLPEPSFVVLQIFDALGRNVRTLARGEQPPGVHTVSWDGRDGGGESLASGIYIYRLSAGTFVQTRKMLLLR